MIKTEDKFEEWLDAEIARLQNQITPQQRNSKLKYVADFIKIGGTVLKLLHLEEVKRKYITIRDEEKK